MRWLWLIWSDHWVEWTRSPTHINNWSKLISHSPLICFLSPTTRSVSFYCLIAGFYCASQHSKPRCNRWVINRLPIRCQRIHSKGDRQSLQLFVCILPSIQSFDFRFVLTILRRSSRFRDKMWFKDRLHTLRFVGIRSDHSIRVRNKKL